MPIKRYKIYYFLAHRKEKFIMSTNTTTKNAEVKTQREEIFVMWKKKSKKGSDYFSGSMMDRTEIRGFYNGKKQNPKEPDMRIYTVVDDKGTLSKEAFISLWCNVSAKGNKYLSGKFNERFITCYINGDANEENKRPYLSAYWSNEADSTKAKTKKEESKEEDLPLF